jgi:hypothetical protein
MSTHSNELELLVARIIDGQLTVAEARRLDGLLGESPETLLHYQELLDAHRTLCAIYPADVYATSSDANLNDPQQDVILLAELIRKRSRPASTIMALGAVAVAIMAMVLLNVSSRLPFSGDSQSGSLPSLGGTLAAFDAIEFPDRGIWSAARDADNAQIARLLRNGVNVDSRLGRKELTPLHFATLYGRTDTAELLLDNEANVMEVDAHGNTALHMAAFFGHKAIAEFLLARGARANEVNAMGHTPLDLVSDEWSPRLAARYEQLSDDMKQRLDPERIRLARLSLVKLLQKHLQQEQGGVAQTHRQQTLHLLTRFVYLRTEPQC